MANTVKVENLSKVLDETLGLYHADIVKAVNKVSGKAARKLAKRTRATAPVGARGKYKRSISSRLLKESPNGDTYVWYVKAPEWRLTHLLVHGHETRDGGRTKSDPFLQNALDEVLPEYEADIREAVKNGK